MSEKEYTTEVITPADARATLDEWMDDTTAIELATLFYQRNPPELRGVYEEATRKVEVVTALQQAGQIAAVLLNIPVRVRLPSESRIAFGNLPEFEFLEDETPPPESEAPPKPAA